MSGVTKSLITYFFQGDILRMAKEHQVLQKQLKEAKEKYEQLQCRSTEETSVLNEQLKKKVEENKVIVKHG